MSAILQQHRRTCRSPPYPVLATQVPSLGATASQKARIGPQERGLPEPSPHAGAANSYRFLSRGSFRGDWSPSPAPQHRSKLPLVGLERKAPHIQLTRVATITTPQKQRIHSTRVAHWEGWCFSGSPIRKGCLSFAVTNSSATNKLPQTCAFNLTYNLFLTLFSSPQTLPNQFQTPPG